MAVAGLFVVSQPQPTPVAAIRKLRKHAAANLEKPKGFAAQNP
jgi:hypothetical protein